MVAPKILPHFIGKQTAITQEAKISKTFSRRYKIRNYTSVIMATVLLSCCRVYQRASALQQFYKHSSGPIYPLHNITQSFQHSASG